jgi:signal recognition particle subunit SRP54
MPGLAPGQANMVKQQMDDRQIRRQIALINAMTPQERRFPKVIDSSRRRRIAAGAGLSVQDLNRLLKQHTQMQKMMKKVTKGGLRNMMRGMPGMGPPR